MSAFRRKIGSAVRQVLKNRWLLRLVGIGVFALILIRMDLGELWRILKSLDLRLLLSSFVLQGIGLVVAAFRWQLIMRQLEIRSPFSRSLVYQLIGTAAALLTPGQIGEFVKVLYHRQDGFPVPESLLSVLIDRLYDLVILLVFGLLAMAILVGLPPAWTLLLVVGSSIVGVAAFLFVRNREQSAVWIGNAIARISPKAYKDMMASHAYRLAQRIGTLRLSALLLWGLLTIGNYALQLFRIYVLFLAAHVQVSFWYFAMVVPLLRLVGLIPVSVSGIGTRDITAIYLLGRAGVAQESALAASMLGLLATPVQALVGLLLWWRTPLQVGQTGALQGQSQGLEQVPLAAPGIKRALSGKKRRAARSRNRGTVQK